MSNPDQSPAVDERAAFIQWLRESFPAAWTEQSATHAWDNNEAAVSAWHSAREPLLDAIAELKARVAPTEAAAMAATVPDEWLLVPVVPTDEMLQSAMLSGVQYASDAWAAFLAAAPQAPVAGQPADTMIPIQEAWEAAGGNPGIRATRESLLEALKQLDDVCDAAGQPAEPSPAVTHLLWLALEHPISSYLMSNAEGRWNGAEKAHCHEELCRYYVAAYRGTSTDRARRDGLNDTYKAVHRATQALTDHMDEVIGFPLEGRPDYDTLAPKFFAEFHRLAAGVLAPKGDSNG